jgi:hypothetical protein
MKYCGKKKQDHNFELQFKGALEFAKNKVELLIEIYTKCSLWIEDIINRN